VLGPQCANESIVDETEAQIEIVRLLVMAQRFRVLEYFLEDGYAEA
jgi:hypothetical protein